MDHKLIRGEHMKSLMLVGLVGTLLVGCAKEKEYDKVHIADPEVHVSKELIAKMCTGEDKCIALPSVGNMPYRVSASRPFWMGEPKLVKFEITKDTLNVLQVETDERYQDVENNNLPVASFDIEHKDYKCAEDANGKCSNKEEEDTEKHWSKRKYVEIDVNSFDKMEVNTLPIEFGELFQAGCFSALSQVVKDVKIEKDAMNLVYTKTYKANPNCVQLMELKDVETLTFAVDYTYSIVKLSTLASKNYKPMAYPTSDQGAFGFFKTTIKNTLVDNSSGTADSVVEYANRFNPNKSEVVYYLTEEFYKKENKYLLDLTHEGIETINRSFREAGAKTRIVLKNGTGKNPGDLRYNFIIFVNDPQKASVLGYGPSVANPLTGEILKAQNVMYYGTLLQTIARTHDEIVAENKARAEGATTSSVVTENEAHSHDHTHDHSANAGLGAHLENVNFNKLTKAQVEKIEKTTNIRMSTILKSALSKSINFHEIESDRIWSLQDVIANAKPEEFDLAKVQKELNSWQEKIEEFSNNNIFHSSMLNVRDAFTSGLDFEATSKLDKFWDDMTEAERKKVIKKVMPHAWNFAIVHEIGHNLGLRHNFAGSTDTKNYYTNRELRNYRIKRDDITYSSVMDYPYTGINKLPIMGKYDVAALKYAYARKVQDMTGKDHPIANTLEETKAELAEKGIILRQFEYCTDENVSNSLTCNRFDEGTDSKTIAEHYIRDFKKWEYKVTHRGRRYNYDSGNGDLSYLMYLFNSYITVRNFFDRYDVMVAYGMDKKALAAMAREEQGRELDPDEKEMVKNYKDTKAASDMSFGFFMDQLTEPGYNCLKIKLADQTFQSIPFTKLSKQSKHIGFPLDIAWGCEYLGFLEQREAQEQGKQPEFVYYSFGKHMNNAMNYFKGYKRMQGNRQIDVRGSWMNKVLAAHLMTIRMAKPSVGEKSSGTYLDHEEYKKQFDEFLSGLLTNRFKKKVTVSHAFSGQSFPVEVEYSFDDTHNIDISHHPGINYFFGLTESSNDLKSIMMKMVKRNIKVSQNSHKDDSIYDSLHVQRLSNWVDVEDQRFKETVMFRKKSGRIKGRFGIWEDGTIGLQLFSMLKNVEYLDTLTKEDHAAYKKLLADAQLNVEIAAEYEILRKYEFVELYMHVLGQAPIEEITEANIPQEVLIEVIQAKIAALENVEVPEKLKKLHELPEVLVEQHKRGELSEDILFKSFLSLAQ
jgi:hypothetical protein